MHPDDLEHTLLTISEAKWPPFIRPTRVAALLDVDRRRVYELIAVGDLEAVRVGGRGLRVVRASLEAFLRRGGSFPR